MVLKGSLMSVQHLFQPLVVEIFQSGPTWWTESQTDGHGKSKHSHLNDYSNTFGIELL